MRTMAAFASDGLDGLHQSLAPSTTEGTDTTVSVDHVDDPFRLLAILNPMLASLLDDLAAVAGPSPVRAVLLALLTEDLARTIGRAQIIAAGMLEDSDAHTLKEEPLTQVHRIHTHLNEFIEGEIALPADQRYSPGTKMLFKNGTDVAKDQLHLSHAQAKQRITTRDLLVPRRGFNGATIEPRFGRLATVFRDGTADPQQIANAARRMANLQPGIAAQPNPQETAARVEEQVAESLVARNQSGTGQLFKLIEAQLDAGALERSEAQMEANFGLQYKGKQIRGFIWEICTGVEGHELLTSVSDQLANPHSQFGIPVDVVTASDKEPTATAQPELPIPDFGDAPDAPAPIAAWAIDPNTPPDQIPVEGFTNIAKTDPGLIEPPGPVPLPGESLAEARQREKGRSLLQYFLDSVLRFSDGESDRTLPKPPTLEMIVTIPLDTLIGTSDQPGVTSHNHLVSPGFARKLAATANVIPAVLGTASQPLDLGRKQRFFSRAQRRAMLLRDKGCINPGCTMAARRCEANHIQPWYLGGESNLSNSALLCATCHASFHAGHFKIVVIDSIPYVLQNRALDPEQQPRRNWIFHPKAATAA